MTGEGIPHRLLVDLLCYISVNITYIEQLTLIGTELLPALASKGVWCVHKSQSDSGSFDRV
jgi:hypothetical protein